jgi:hypothetical protein
VGLGNEAGPQQLRERVRIDRIGLHLGIGDRLQELRMGQAEVNALGGQQVAQPVPAAGHFHHRPLLPGPLGEVLAEESAIVGNGHLHHALALRRERGENRIRAVLIDAGVEHERLPGGDRGA